MSTGYYLLDHPNPNKTQYRTSRRAKPSGAIVLHTPEAGLDTKPPDTKARDVLAFIARRDSYGSYHAGVDSDSIDLGAPWDHEVWGSSARSPHRHQVDNNGERLRSNSIAIHLFIACDHNDWTTMPVAWMLAAIERLAILASNAADWLKTVHGIEVPPRIGTAEEFWDLRPGFYYHGTIQPANRKDPGREFPADMFLDEYHEAVRGIPPAGNLVARIKAVLRSFEYTIPDGPYLDERTAAGVEDLGRSVRLRMAEVREAEVARDAAISNAADLDQKLADAIAERAATHDRNVKLEQFVGRMAAHLVRADQAENELAMIIQAAREAVDEISADRIPDGG